MPNAMEMLKYDGLLSESEEKEYYEKQALLQKTNNTIELLKLECDDIRKWITEKNISFSNRFLESLKNKKNEN